MEQQEEIRRAVALKAAVIIGTSGSTVIVLADKFLAWLKKEKTTLPQPTLQQKQVLDAINAELNLDEDVLYTEVLAWIEKEVGKRVYPQRESSVQKFINYYKEKPKWQNGK